MRFRIKVAVALAVLLFPARAVFAADDLKTVLMQLNAAASRFHSTSADFEFDTAQTEPIPDTNIQTGTVYYDRKGGAFQIGIHIDKENGRAVPKVIVVSGGLFKMYEKVANQVTTSKRVSKYESYLVLGFGASGNDLEEKWNITDLGSEMLNGIKVVKLQLIAKDPEVLKLFPKVTIWIDPERGVSLKQYFDEGQGQSRTCIYSNIKVNQSLPGDAFKIDTNSKTQFVNR